MWSIKLLWSPLFWYTAPGDNFCAFGPHTTAFCAFGPHTTPVPILLPPVVTGYYWPPAHETFTFLPFTGETHRCTGHHVNLQPFDWIYLPRSLLLTIAFSNRYFSLCRTPGEKAVPPHSVRGGRAATACLCSQMAVQLLSLVNRPCCQLDRMRDQMSQMQEMKRTRQGCLVLFCPGWSTTLCADGSRWPMLFITLPWTATAGLLSAAAGMPTIRASRTAWNTVTATAFTVRGNVVYSFTSTRTTLTHSSTSASIPMHRPATRNRLTQPSTTGKLCSLFLTTCATSHIPIMCASSVQGIS